MARIVLERLRRKFGPAVIATSGDFGNETAVVERAVLAEAATFLRDDPELLFDMPIDCTAVDWHRRRELRFDVVWHLYATEPAHRVRLKVAVPEEEPSVASLTPMWPGFNWFEREVWDLYGVRFTGHPDLRRILLYEPFVGHPLRKDYPIDRRQPLIRMREPTGEIPTQRNAPPELINQP